MRSIVMTLAAAGALMACGQGAQNQNNPNQNAATQTPAPLELTCAAFANMSGEALAARFGAENIVDQTRNGPEGETYEATMVFANDPARALEIVWADPATRARPLSVLVAGEASQWVGPGGLRVGAAIAAVEQANGRPFTLYGFDWDYGGRVADWRGGALAQPDCRMEANFAPQGDNTSASGDQEFASNAPEMRAADPRLTAIGVRIGAVE